MFNFSIKIQIKTTHGGGCEQQQSYLQEIRMHFHVNQHTQITTMEFHPGLHKFCPDFKILRQPTAKNKTKKRLEEWMKKAYSAVTICTSHSKPLAWLILMLRKLLESFSLCLPQASLSFPSQSLCTHPRSTGCRWEHRVQVGADQGARGQQPQVSPPTPELAQQSQVSSMCPSILEL